ncbi:hypothetical protein CDAR_77391 [Caerostris darwini]|uniref:Reverse transcriptase domain-containing protein n=1 Tax=Caerostris darwini TaxID=1538125 RepID=A0AAV4N4X8_9ARAC|nr:hypothetical protein CDAR_77391 [Caerostris darwini]
MDSKAQQHLIIGGHINLGNARAAMAQLQDSIRNLDLDYISLNEPYSFNNQITCIPLNYTIAASLESPKAAIVIKSTLNAQIVICYKEVVIIQATLNNQETILVSAYCPPNKNLDATLLIIRNAISKFTNRPILDLAVENSPESLPTYSSSRGDSWIDLLLTRNLASEITLEVTDHISNSDHNLLIIRHLSNVSQCPNTRRLSINKINWIKLKTTLHHILKDQTDPDLFPASVINSLIQQLQDTIFTAISKLKDNTNSRNSKPQKKKNAIWWTRELEIKRSKTRALRRLFQKERDTCIRAKKKKSLKKLVRKGYFPATWKATRVILIEKKGKTFDHPSHFRTICILPTWGKILDKIITERLTFHLESSNLLSDNQFGFRRNHPSYKKYSRFSYKSPRNNISQMASQLSQMEKDQPA